MPNFNHADPKEKKVIFSSRLDKEKNPYFMLEVAEKFLDQHPEWTWTVTTSSSKLRSNVPGVVEAVYDLAKRNDRFIVKENLTKDQYYAILAQSSIQFSSALQDWVSFTCVEATMFGCDIVYPDFRSFKEFVPKDRKYHAFDVDDAVFVLSYTKDTLRNYSYISDLAHIGLHLEGYIMANDITEELNVWQESKYCKSLLA